MPRGQAAIRQRDFEAGVMSKSRGCLQLAASAVPRQLVTGARHEGRAACRNAPEAESISSVSEQHVKRHLIVAQSAAIARAMASICNDEQGAFGLMSERA